MNFLRAPSWPGFFRSLIRGSGVSSPACLIHSTSSSVMKLHKALAIAKRMAPACADLPPPETVQVTSCFSSRSRKWKGNINCSLRHITTHGLSLLWRCDFVTSYKNQMMPAAVNTIYRNTDPPEVQNAFLMHSSKLFGGGWGTDRTEQYTNSYCLLIISWEPCKLWKSPCKEVF